MIETATVNREQLKGIFDIENLDVSTFKVTISPISESEADDFEFRSLKGIAGKLLDIDEIRRERLGI